MVESIRRGCGLALVLSLIALLLLYIGQLLTVRTAIPIFVVALSALGLWLGAQPLERSLRMAIHLQVVYVLIAILWVAPFVWVWLVQAVQFVSELDYALFGLLFVIPPYLAWEVMVSNRGLVRARDANVASGRIDLIRGRLNPSITPAYDSVSSDDETPSNSSNSWGRYIATVLAIVAVIITRWVNATDAVSTLSAISVVFYITPNVATQLALTLELLRLNKQLGTPFRLSRK